ERDPTGTMTLVEHLSELRSRLINSILAVGAGSVIGWFLFQPVFDLLRHPYCTVIKAHPTLYPFGNPSNCALAYTSPIGPFVVKIKIVTFLGLAIALPVVLYQVWRFITPGLTGRERRYAIPFVLTSVVLFLTGATIAYLLLPKALDFLLGFAGTSLVAVLDVSTYVTFFMFMTLAFGVSFEFPMVLIALVMVGILNSQRLRKARRGAIVGIAVFAVIITPTQDWFTNLAIIVPLV